MNTKGKRLAPFPKIYANPGILWLWATFDQTSFLFWVLKNALSIADFFSAIHLKTWPLRKKTYSYFLHEFNADMQTELSGQSDQAP